MPPPLLALSAALLAGPAFGFDGRPDLPAGGRTVRPRPPWWAVLAAGVGVVGLGGAVLFLTAALLVRRAAVR